jgi:hypothetical protein
MPCSPASFFLLTLQPLMETPGDVSGVSSAVAKERALRDGGKADVKYNPSI